MALINFTSDTDFEDFQQEVSDRLAEAGWSPEIVEMHVGVLHRYHAAELTVEDTVNALYDVLV